MSAMGDDSMNGEYTVVTGACACRQLQASVKVPNKHLPLRFQFCHCWTCRHLSGALTLTYIPIPEDHKDLEIKGTPTKYWSGRMHRCFCGTCGASVYEEGPGEDFGFAGGSLIDPGENLLKLDHHIFVEDTKDGGMRDWMPSLPSWEGWAKSSNEVPEGQLYSIPGSHDAVGRDEKEVRCRCHCGGVQFKITRVNEHSYRVTSPFSEAHEEYDKFAPEGEGGKNPENKAWWIRANGEKYAANTCVCISCREGSGYDLTNWAFVPAVNILQLDGSPLDLKMGTLKEYNRPESKDCFRNFCGTCGAIVFYHADDRAYLMDVAVGLFDAPEGSRAESWLDWMTSRVGYEEFGQKRFMIEPLKKGFKEWQEKKIKAKEAASMA